MMATKKQPEVWLRGPIPNVPALLQPVAHCLLQAREEINELMIDFPEKLLWERPAGLASPGFHLLHLKGVADRLFTYAKGSMLTEEQLQYLKSEGDGTSSLATMIGSFNDQIEKAIQQLSITETNTITETRFVGRAKIASTVLGLYVHAAEHTMRHLGQLLVTVKILKANNVTK